jgi:LmbE family N-acetylglucosaminyl deacetylase
LLPICDQPNLILMMKTRLWRPLGCLLVFSVLFSPPAGTQTKSPKISPVDPLSQDSGSLGLKQMLVRLGTTARLMQTVAHPDDEDGGMLTLESRGKGASVLLLTLNRGEGGQNKVGSNLFDVLGVLRTLELTAADRYYGVEQRFTRVADFGFSKNPEETFQKWHGHDIALGDMVRVIRTFRPDILIPRFSGTERDGHGHHQASNLLAKEAFRAAADANRFPEQIKEGLHPWQAKKLYQGNVCGFGATSCPSENYTIKLNVGKRSDLLGMSYIQFALEGLKHQLSQGAGGWTVDDGDRFTFYKLLDSVVESSKDKEGHEQDFFDGIDTSLPGLAARLGDEASKLPALKATLTDMQSKVTEAGFAKDPAQPLLAGLAITRRLIEETRHSSLSPAAKDALLTQLTTKQEQFEQAANCALDLQLHVMADVPEGENAEYAFMAVPGTTFNLAAETTSARPAEVKTIELDLPQGWKAKRTTFSAATPGRSYRATFEVTVPADAQYTRPYWHRANPETDTVNVIDVPQDLTLPFPPAPIRAHAIYAASGGDGVVKAVGMEKYKDPTLGEVKRAIAVAPPFSISLEPATEVISTSHSGSTEIVVGIRSNIATKEDAKLRLELPSGWTSEPAVQPVRFKHAGESATFKFQVKPSDLKENRHQLQASLTYGGKSYNLGYNVVTREDLDTFYYYQPAVQRVSIVDAKSPTDRKIAYIMGAGDDIPTVLKQIGLNVTLIPAENIGKENLGAYQTIVLGIRAYDTQKELIANNKKLLDYVHDGGTLIVQYNAGVGDFNSGHFTPYPAQISRTRVSVEEAPVQILAPEDKLFHFPNEITQRDFDGWVQERGLNFMDQWDNQYKPLLACQDPGEAFQKGGMLRAQYGKGTYIYTGYAFFRQLPAGVPGAIRLYVNLLSQ